VRVGYKVGNRTGSKVGVPSTGLEVGTMAATGLEVGTTPATGVGFVVPRAGSEVGGTVSEQGPQWPKLWTRVSCAALGRSTVTERQERTIVENEWNS
jgi:hypothetical protein